MSIDDRLRHGLPMLAEEGPVDLEHELVHLLDRAARRRRWRIGAYACGVGAAVAVAVALATAPDPGPESVGPVSPVTDQVRVLDSARGSEVEPAALDAGRYAVPFVGSRSRAPLGVVTLPPGWSQDQLALTTGLDLDPHLRRIEMFAVGAVSPDPCRASTAPVRRNIDDLVEALSSQQSMQARRPVPLLLDAYRGSRISFEVPQRLGSRSCPTTSSTLVPVSTPQGSSYDVFPGWTYQLWIVEVGREPLVVAVGYGPEVTSAERAEVERMVLDIDFASPDLLVGDQD